MGWLAAAIFGVAVIYFSIHYSGFRKVLLWSLAGIAVIGAVGGVFLYLNSLHEANRAARAKTLIAESDVDFFDMSMASTSIGSRIVKGKVRNRSRYTLKSFKLRITVRDCPKEKCETIGQNDLSEYLIDVPPGQVRSFDRYVTFLGMPEPTAMKWYYSIEELEAKVD